ncbi:MAG: hypothetical protein MUC81_02220 [Bacteroidia bacterium]|jgi:hypothetical protein|nr:hypothetical protein [Bacteroidia bacterium]
MKNYLFISVALLLVVSCKPKLDGMQEVKTPFKGNKYESNNRWWRAVASGESTNLQTSRDKAMLSAKQRLASSVQTQIKSLSENYVGERQVGENLGDFNERFQQLTREVLNQIIVDIRLIDEKTFKSEKSNQYTTWLAIEAKKSTTYKKLKEIALQRNNISDKDKKVIQEMIDKAIDESEKD